MKVYEVIKHKIDDNGIRMNFVGDKCGMSDSAICNSLKGKRSIKTIEFIRMCKTLDMTLDDFTDCDG